MGQTTINRSLLRQKVLANRDHLSTAERRTKSQAVLSLLNTLKPFQNSHCLFCYINYRSEVETRDIVTEKLAAGITISVPLTLPGEGLEAYKISNLKSDLTPGFCSILEPRADRTEKIDPSKIDVVLLPGSVFDPQGGRLGYGGGYYDRFLSESAPQALRIGLSFELQVVDQVPMLDHDMPLDYLVTEARLLKTRRL